MNTNKKTIIQTLLLAIVILAIPLSVQLIQKQTQLKSKAEGAGIVPVESDTLKCTGQTCTTSKAEVELKLDSPFGSPIGVGTTGAQ